MDLRSITSKFQNNVYSVRAWKSSNKWFFGVLAASFVVDIVDTLLKGADYFLQSTWEYPVRDSIHFLLCIVAMFVSNRRFHAWLVLLFILYELSYILRLFDTVK